MLTLPQWLEHTNRCEQVKTWVPKKWMLPKILLQSMPLITMEHIAKNLKRSYIQWMVAAQILCNSIGQAVRTALDMAFQEVLQKTSILLTATKSDLLLVIGAVATLKALNSRTLLVHLSAKDLDPEQAKIIQLL